MEKNKYSVVQLSELMHRLLKGEQDINNVEGVLIEYLSRFKCSKEPDLEKFLVKNSIRYEQEGYGRTYLVVSEIDSRILAYFTVALGNLEVFKASKKGKRKALGDLPGKDSVDNMPAFLIGQLGRADNCTAQELSGEILLSECYHKLNVASQCVGGSLVMLECRENMYSKFYEKYGYNKLRPELNEQDLYTLFKRINFNDYN